MFKLINQYINSSAWLVTFVIKRVFKEFTQFLCVYLCLILIADCLEQSIYSRVILRVFEIRISVMFTDLVFEFGYVVCTNIVLNNF